MHANKIKKQTEKPQFKKGDRVYNLGAGQRSKVLNVSWDEEEKIYMYTLKCLQDEGSIHLACEDQTTEVEKVKMTVEDLIEFYEENNEDPIEVIIKK